MGGIKMKQRYDSYKPSGIDWIGDIPTHWKLPRVKQFVKINNGSDPKTEGDIPVYGSGSCSFKTCGEFKLGPTVLLGRKGATLHIPHWIEGKYWNVDTAFDTKIIGNLNLRLFFYFSMLFNYEKYKSETTLPSMTQTDYGNMYIPLPSLAEQEAIAAWLDEKCGEIDAAIAKVDREIELIDELKQSEISRVVTRGLNPDTPLRPSGIDWINEIPVNWSSMKLKHTVKNIESDFMDGDWIESTDISTEGVRYLTSGNIGAGFYKEQGEGFISEDTFAELDCIEVFPGDLLISRLNEPIARTCFIPNLGYRIVTCVDNVIYRPKLGQFDKRFMMYQLNSKPFWFNASQLSSGATMQRISRSKLGSIKIIVPPLSEQQAIADYLDKKCAEIDGLKAKLVKKRETLKELRQSIISEIVTGKRKVI